MAQPAATSGWLRGRVKAVPSGDSLVIMGFTKAEIPPEKTIVLAHLSAPRLARRGGTDDPFAWESREFLRKLCIGKDVVFKTEYTIPNFSREFCSLFIGTTNIAKEVVTHGWAKVKEAKGEVTPEHAELLRLEEQARQKGVGLWNRSPGAAAAAIRNLPPSAVGDPSNLDAMGLLASSKGTPMEAIVEQVRDGSSLRVYLLPDFQFVQVFVAGIQAPSMGRRTTIEPPATVTEIPSQELNGGDTNNNNNNNNNEIRGPLTSAQRVTASSTFNEVAPDPYGREAKHFTEIRVLNRDVRIVLEGVDKFSNLIGSVYYPDGDSAKDLALELIENGIAKYVEWSASMMEDEARRNLKSAELQAKKNKIRLWTNYVPPPTNSKAISDKFTGKVVEVVSGDCIIVADDSVPFGSPSAERRVNLSSIRCPKLGNPRRDEKPAPYAREAREFLRTRLIGRQVQVSMEYSRKVPTADGLAAPAGPTDARVMAFGSVFLPNSNGKEGDQDNNSKLPGVNVAELVIARGFGTVIRHRDFEERSNHYENLLAAESRATSGRKGIHSSKDPPVMHVTDLLTASAKKAKDFLPFLQRNRRMAAVVEYVLSGHRFKLFVPKETCSIAFSFSGVRCPGRDEPYSNEAISLMRRRIMQRDVEIEVETVDRTGTFLGSLWDSKSNVAITLLEAGLARIQTSFGTDRIPDAHLLAQAQQFAKNQKLKIWENYVEGEEVPNSKTNEKKQKEEFNAVVTEVLGGGKFYLQAVTDQKVAAIQNQLASLTLKEAPVIGSFNPKNGDLVIAQFTADNSWNRAMVVNAPRGAIQPLKDKFEVFYIDYGNQEVVTYNQLRPLDQSVSSAPGMAQLCSLAYLKVPDLEEEFGHEAAMFLSDTTLTIDPTLNVPKEFRAVVEDKEISSSGGKVNGQGTGDVLMVTLIDETSGQTVNSKMLTEGAGRLEKRRRWDAKEKQAVLDEMEKYESEARVAHKGIWRYGDIDSDDDDQKPLPFAKKNGGKR